MSLISFDTMVTIVAKSFDITDRIDAVRLVTDALSAYTAAMIRRGQTFSVSTCGYTVDEVEAVVTLVARALRAQITTKLRRAKVTLIPAAAIGLQ